MASVDNPFVCESADSSVCEGTVYKSCVTLGEGEFYEVRQEDCGATDQQCAPDRGCVPCFPGTYRCATCRLGDQSCNPEEAQRCSDDGNEWELKEVCDREAGFGCFQGECVDLCQQAFVERSYVGCVFLAADLDNAAIDEFNDASSQQYAVVVANPYNFTVGVVVEWNTAPQGQPTAVEVVEQRDVPPGGLEAFELPRREVDGSSEHGLNDGTHTALTSNAYRITATHPITAYQFNPLDNVNVFSNDASLLLPTSALGTDYTVVGWPQTIGDSDDPTDDFDPTATDEDLRAFLTVIASEETEIQLEMGQHVGTVIGAGPIAEMEAGSVLNLKIDAFDVINLESDGKDGDFTGTLIRATKPVAVFSGSEASDVPSFASYAQRRCCADHLEEQLFPDRTLGTSFTIARMPARSRALANAAVPEAPLSVALVDELEWVRVVAVAAGITRVETSLPSPDDEFMLAQYDDAMIEASQDFTMEASAPIAVLQALPSQAQTGIARQFPGGDPAIIAVPPAQQYRRDYIFLTPDKYAFDFITIVADAGTSIFLDGAPLSILGCETSPADGREHADDDPPDRVIHRCQLSFPLVTGGIDSMVMDGHQNDGRHVLEADQEIGVVVYGFDRFVSYAYAAGLNLISLE